MTTTKTAMEIVPTLDEIKAEIKAKHFYGSDTVSLVYVDYRSHLDAEMVAEYVMSEDFSHDGWDWLWEAQAESVWEIIQPYRDDLTPAQEDELQQWIESCDDSNPIADLVRNTDDVAMVMFGEELYRAVEDVDTEKIDAAMKELGVELTADELATTQAEAWGGGQATVRVMASVEDARKLYQEGGTFTVREPDVGLLDRYNGAGWLDRPDREFTITVKKGELVPETASGGYNWMEIAGVTNCGTLSIVK